MEKVINLGGFRHSSLIEKNLIDYLIPFLPMERPHVKFAKADLEKKGHPVTDSILNFQKTRRYFLCLVVRKFQAKLTM